MFKKKIVNKMNFNFKKEHSFFKRQEESKRIITKYPDRIPIIVSKMIGSDIMDIDKHKFLVPIDLTMGQFIYVIRKRIKLSPEKAMYLFCNDVLSPTAALISNIYSNHKDDDGFLYIVYAAENTFG